MTSAPPRLWLVKVMLSAGILSNVFGEDVIQVRDKRVADLIQDRYVLAYRNTGIIAEDLRRMRCRSLSLALSYFDDFLVSWRLWMLGSGPFMRDLYLSSFVIVGGIRLEIGFAFKIVI